MLPPNSGKKTETADFSKMLVVTYLSYFLCDEIFLRKLVKLSLGFMYVRDCNRRIPKLNSSKNFSSHRDSVAFPVAKLLCPEMLFRTG